MGNCCCAQTKKSRKTLYSYDSVNHLPKLSPNDFEIIRYVGKGGFGTVFLVKKKDSQKQFCMKVVQKDLVSDKINYRNMYSERDSMINQSCPYLTNLYCTFQTKSKLYFITEYYPGGDLNYHIQQTTLPESLVAFYTAEVIVALDALHQQNYIYRDLKPENLLLDENGHIHLIDFGLCKKYTPKRRWSTGGTPDYLPPEVLEKQPFSFEADWWQLGIMVWFMLTQKMPFDAPTTRELYENIKQKLLQKPNSMSISISLIK